MYWFEASNCFYKYKIKEWEKMQIYHFYVLQSQSFNLRIYHLMENFIFDRIYESHTFCPRTSLRHNTFAYYCLTRIHNVSLIIHRVHHSLQISAKHKYGIKTWRIAQLSPAGAGYRLQTYSAWKCERFDSSWWANVCNSVLHKLQNFEKKLLLSQTIVPFIAKWELCKTRARSFIGVNW